MPTLTEDIEQIERQTASKFPSEVVRIRHHIGEDWAGDPSVTFRIVLSDAVVHPGHLLDVTSPIEEEIFDEMLRREPKYYPYFQFRSKTEYDTLKDPAWE